MPGCGKWSWGCDGVRGESPPPHRDPSHCFIPGLLPWGHQQGHHRRRRGSPHRACPVALRDPSRFLNSCHGDPLDEETQGKWASGSPSTLQPHLGWVPWGANMPGDMLRVPQVLADGRCQPFLDSLSQTMVSL